MELLATEVAPAGPIATRLERFPDLTSLQVTAGVTEFRATRWRCIDWESFWILPKYQKEYDTTKSAEMHHVLSCCVL